MCAIHSTKETTTAESPSANTRVLRHSPIGKWSRTINTARLRSEKLNMRCTCCLFMLTLWSAAAGCNNRMPMCIGSFSLHSKWIGLSKRDPNSSVLRRDVESDRLIGNLFSVFNFVIIKCTFDREQSFPPAVYFLSQRASTSPEYLKQHASDAIWNLSSAHLHSLIPFPEAWICFSWMRNSNLQTSFIPFSWTEISFWFSSWSDFFKGSSRALQQIKPF